MKDPILELFQADVSESLYLPYIEEGVRAGFPSPAQDYVGETIDLNKLLIEHPASTFFGRVKGDSLVDADIHNGDILIIDKSLDPKHKDLVVCSIEGEFTLKYLHIKKNGIYLMPANPNYKPIELPKDFLENDTHYFTIWGVVTYTIHKQRKARR